MEIIDKTCLYKGHYILNKLTIRDGKEVFEREQFHRGNSAAALLFDTEKERFVLVKQFRPGPENFFIEIVAGTVEGNEDPQQTIMREISEETGYIADKTEFISVFYLSPGSSTEKLYLYYCEVTERAGSGGGIKHDHEKIELVYLDQPENVFAFEDAKTIIAFSWYMTNKQK